MANILILSGGSSSEREVSLRSGAAVKVALESLGHKITNLDPSQKIADEAFAGYDAIFPVLHGAGGEDGILQERLEKLGHNNIVGSDSVASKICFDKWSYKLLLQQNAIANPAGALLALQDIQSAKILQSPFVLKPYDGGSSVDTFIVRDVAAADFAKIEQSFSRHDHMLAEALVEGIEITVGVLGDMALPVIEIIPPADQEFDYENKYNGATQELCPPKNVSESVQIRAQALALQIHKLCGCRDMSRTDMIITADDELYVLETNTIPGMTDQSLLPKAAATADIPMAKLCNRLVNMAVGRAANA